MTRKKLAEIGEQRNRYEQAVAKINKLAPCQPRVDLSHPCDLPGPDIHSNTGASIEVYTDGEWWFRMTLENEQGKVEHTFYQSYAIRLRDFLNEWLPEGEVDQ